jgi:hypothetical protein
MTADRVDTKVVAAGYHSQVIQSFTGTATVWTLSCFAKAASGSPTIYLMMTPDGVTYRSAPCSPTTSAWTRCSATGTLTATTWYAQIGVDRRDGTQSAKPDQSVYLWGCSLYPGPGPGQYYPTTSAPVSAPATVPTAQNPLVGYAGDFYVSVEYDAASWTTFPSGAVSKRPLAGGPVAGPNSWRIEFYSGYANTVPYFGVLDSSSALKGVGHTGALSAGFHRVTGCATAAGGLSLYIDGVLDAATTVTGSVGTGVLASQPATIYLGTSDQGLGDSGTYRSIRIGKGCRP